VTEKLSKLRSFDRQ